MAETTAAFYSGAFSNAFFIVDVVPSLFTLRVSDEQRHIEAGQAVVIMAKIVDETTTFGRKYLFTPGEKPEITVYNPDGTVAVAATDMDEIEKGIFRYRHQTSVNDDPGSYSVVISAVNGSMTMISRKHVVFTIIAP